MTDEARKARPGFASMPRERRAAISRKGGINVPAHKRPFSSIEGLAQRAGTRGGRRKGKEPPQDG